MGKTTQQTTQSSSPPPQVLANYQDLVNRAQTVANTPYQSYQGQIVPDFTTSQLNAFDALDQSGNVAPQYYNQAASYLNAGANPNGISNANTSQYVSPFAVAGASGAMGAGQGLAGYGMAAGQNIANYGNNAGNNIANYASGIGAAGPQLQQYNQQNLQQFLNPYTQNVIDTTGANIDRSNAVQSNNLTGSAIQAGNAFGGDRAGVAQAELARNQALAKNQTMAGLESAGFTNAQQAFNTNNAQALAGQQTALGGIGQGAALGLGAQTSGAQLGLSGQQAGGQLGLAGAQLGTSATQNAQQLALQQQQAQLSAGNSLGNLGGSALQSYLAAANAQLQGGNQQQAQAGANLQVPYQQFLQQQAYPFQTTQFLGNTIMGTGSASGGTSQTTSPGPNVLGQVAGLGATALGAFLSDERAKENIQPVGKTFDGQPIYRYNYKGEPATQMGLIAQNVEHSHPGAVTEHGGFKYVNYEKATEGAAERGHFAGGGVVNMASGAPGMFQPIDFSNTGVRGYVPSPGDMKMGVGPPKPPGAPSANSAASPGLSGAFSAIGKGLGHSDPSYGGGNMVTGEYGGSSSNPLEGLTAADYGEGFYAGGLVPGYGAGMHFADGGMPDDPFGDDNRAAGYDLLRQGLGSVAPDAISGGEPAPEPIRMPSQEATAAWRRGVDADMAAGPDGPVVAQNAPMPSPRPAGLGAAPSLPPQITGPTPDDGTAMAYDSPQRGGVASAPNPGGQAALNAAMAANAPQPVEKPSIGQALMAAGLGMMSSRSPTLLGGIGEGGQAGLANYAGQQKAYNELDAHPIIDHNGPTTRIYYPSTKQWIDTGIPTMTAGQKAANELQKSESARTQGNADRSYKLQERAQERLEAKDESPAGYRKNKDGALEAIPGGPADPATIKSAADAKRGTAGLLDDDTIHDMAGQYLEGDKSVMQNLGRGAQGAENIVKLRAEIGRQAREAGMTPREVATKMADFAGRTAAMRTLGTKGANIEYAANTANKAIDLAEEAYSKLPRGQFLPLNQLREMYEKKTSSAEQAAAYAATNTLVNEYARVASGGSSTATEGMRQHAREMLNTAQGPDAFNAVLKMMRREIQTAKAAYNETRKEFLTGDHPGERTDAASTPPAPTGGAKPTLKEFLAKAKEANPGATDAQLTEFYNKKYGS